MRILIAIVQRELYLKKIGKLVIPWTGWTDEAHLSDDLNANILKNFLKSGLMPLSIQIFQILLWLLLGVDRPRAAMAVIKIHQVNASN